MPGLQELSFCVATLRFDDPGVVETDAVVHLFAVFCKRVSCCVKATHVVSMYPWESSLSHQCKWSDCLCMEFRRPARETFLTSVRFLVAARMAQLLRQVCAPPECLSSPAPWIVNCLLIPRTIGLRCGINVRSVYSFHILFE